MAKSKLNNEDIIKDRMAYIGTLASGLAHEINNPLNSISLNTDLLIDDINKLKPDLQHSLMKKVSRIKSETENLQKILSEFLTFARPRRLETEVIDINEFIYDMIDFLEPELKKSMIHVKFDLDEELYPILVDPRQLHQVLFNLFKNAIEAITEKRPEHPQIIVCTRGHETFLEIRISDNGEGIPEHFREKIFEVFFTTKEKGTGLGLGIVSRILSEHQGTIKLDVEDSKAGLTTFVITLPKSIHLGFENDKEELGKINE